MPRHSTLWRTVLVLSPIMFLCGAVATTGVSSAKALPLIFSAEVAQRGCAATADADIVAAIQEKIKADKRFKDQWPHINVSSKNRVVTLGGWARGRAQVQALVRLARTTKCVRRVVNKLWDHLTGGCDAGQKECGDTCIDKNDTCNLMRQ
jgi:hypothetical protein